MYMYIYIYNMLGIQVSLATCIYVCLSGLWLGGLLHLSFLSDFLKLVYMYFHVYSTCTCISVLSDLE